jgi:Thioredoxin-like
MMTPRLLAVLLLIPLGALRADWSQITDLDHPVTRLSPDAKKAAQEMKARFEAQIAANEAFLKEFQKSPHAYESNVRLAVAKAKLASLEQNGPAVKTQIDRLKELERQAPDDSQRAETMFRRISLEWQNLGDTREQRHQNATALAGKFATEFPRDRRAPRLLAEAAAFSDNNPEEKSKLIDLALSLSKEEPLTLRLKDDRKRLDQLGKPVELKFKDTDGVDFDMTRERGHVVALVFWSAESAPCLVWMRYFATYAADVPALKVVSVSLDHDRIDLKSAMQALSINWPTSFEGMGWNDPIARRFGINTLPTVWLIDKRGCLQSLNARDDYELKIKTLLLQN